ncbi:MAG TPA: ATP-binding protein [Chloroflexota bacterium]|nr:ATP-binding protein [Chloroflexota bacterium]
MSAAARAPFDRAPTVLADITPPNLYTLRGPRRVGKSTLLKQTIARLCAEGVDPRRICYFAADALSSFNDLINLFQAARLLFPDLGDQPRYFLLDEVTAIPDWQRGVKWVRDNTPAAGDCVVATGSSARDVAAGATYLAGRRGPDVRLDRLLLPMAFPEFVRCAGFDLPSPPSIPLSDFYAPDGKRVCQESLVHVDTAVEAFEAFLLVGGFPQAVADFRQSAHVSDGFARDLWDVIQADLRTLGMSRPEQGLRLLERVATSLSSQLVLRALGEELDVSHTTAGTWLGALADAYLVLFLFQESAGMPDVRRQRKVYPVDPFLAHLPARRARGAYDPEPSRLAEAALAAAIFRAVGANAFDRFDEPEGLFYFRSPSGGEVDFVVPAPSGTPPTARSAYAAESKYVDAVTANDSRAIVANFDGGLLLTRGAIDLAEHVPGVTVVPASLFAWLLDQHG